MYKLDFNKKNYIFKKIVVFNFLFANFKNYSFIRIRNSLEFSIYIEHIFMSENTSLFKKLNFFFILQNGDFPFFQNEKS